VAFSKEDLARYSLDESDITLWKKSGCTALLIDIIERQKQQALKNLLKGGAKKHDEHTQCYEAFNKLIKLINDI
jgi:hypothetical protein